MDLHLNPNVVFWILSFLLLVVALAFLLPPLLRKPTDIIDDRREQNISITQSQLAELEEEFKQGGLEEETYLQAKDELEEALYDDLDEAEDGNFHADAQKHSKLPVLLVALFVPILATGMYLKIGEPRALTESSASQHAQANNADKADSSKPKLSMEQMVVRLEGKLKKEPDNLKGWSMLGRSYMLMNRPEDATTAYEKALALSPDDTSLLLQMADALGASNDGNLMGKPETYIHQALKQEPDNLMGLWLAGMSAKQRGAKEEAIGYWKRVLPRLGAGSKERQEVIQLITAEGGSVDAVGDNSADAPSSSTAALSADALGKQSITLKIDLEAGLKAKTNPDLTVFIYAKAVTGPPMPLAAIRKQVKDLPIEVTLDDSMAMMPQLKLSGFKQVTVGARVSIGGTPTKSPGDLYIEKSPVSVGEAETVSLMINKVVK